MSQVVNDDDEMISNGNSLFTIILPYLLNLYWCFYNYIFLVSSQLGAGDSNSGLYGEASSISARSVERFGGPG